MAPWHRGGWGWGLANLSFAEGRETRGEKHLGIVETFSISCPMMQFSGVFVTPKCRKQIHICSIACPRMLQFYLSTLGKHCRSNFKGILAAEISPPPQQNKWKNSTLLDKMVYCLHNNVKTPEGIKCASLYRKRIYKSCQCLYSKRKNNSTIELIRRASLISHQ